MSPSWQYSFVAAAALVVPGSAASILASEGADKADPAHLLERGKDLYFENDFQAAVDILERTLADGCLPDDLKVRALQYKAFSLEALNKHSPARATWAQLLELQPDFRIDPADASRELIEAFKDVRAAPINPLPPALDQPARRCGVALCMVPFGIGQYANGRPAKAYLFAGLSALLLTGNIASHYAMTAEFDKGRNQQAVNRYCYMQNTFLGLFAATAAAGVIDAFLFP